MGDFHATRALLLTEGWKAETHKGEVFSFIDRETAEKAVKEAKEFLKEVELYLKKGILDYKKSIWKSLKIDSQK